jgi:hypothetical protein
MLGCGVTHLRLRAAAMMSLVRVGCSRAEV